MNYKIFYELLNQLESDDKLRDSEQGQLTIDRDRNCQLNGSHEEITSVHEDSLKKNLLSLVPSHQSDKILLLPLRSAL